MVEENVRVRGMRGYCPDHFCRPVTSSSSCTMFSAPQRYGMLTFLYSFPHSFLVQLLKALIFFLLLFLFAKQQKKGGLKCGGCALVGRRIEILGRVLQATHTERLKRPVAGRQTSSRLFSVPIDRRSTACRISLV